MVMVGTGMMMTDSRVGLLLLLLLVAVEGKEELVAGLRAVVLGVASTSGRCCVDADVGEGGAVPMTVMAFKR
jgi:hypothetical protein